MKLRARRVYRAKGTYDEPDEPLPLSSTLAPTAKIAMMILEHPNIATFVSVGIVESAILLSVLLVLTIAFVVVAKTFHLSISDTYEGVLALAVVVAAAYASLKAGMRFGRWLPDLSARQRRSLRRKLLRYRVGDETLSVEEFGVQPSEELWAYRNIVYAVPKHFEPEQQAVMVRREYERETALLDPNVPHREYVPLDVQAEVYRRCDNSCVRCGGTLNLELDHIIPLARGGSNTARNLQLLCQRCNREKGGMIDG